MCARARARARVCVCERESVCVWMGGRMCEHELCECKSVCERSACARACVCVCASCACADAGGMCEGEGARDADVRKCVVRESV